MGFGNTCYQDGSILYKPLLLNKKKPARYKFLVVKGARLVVAWRKVTRSLPGSVSVYRSTIRTARPWQRTQSNAQQCMARVKVSRISPLSLVIAKTDKIHMLSVSVTLRQRSPSRLSPLCVIVTFTTALYNIVVHH